MMDRWVLVIDPRQDDYYAGTKARLFRNGEAVWCGYSWDAAEGLLGVVLGDALEVRTEPGSLSNNE